MESILDCDVVAVLDAGRLVEVEQPAKLLGEEESAFRDMREAS